MIFKAVHKIKTCVLGALDVEKSVLNIKMNIRALLVDSRAHQILRKMLFFELTWLFSGDKGILAFKNFTNRFIWPKITLGSAWIAKCIFDHR